MRGLSGKFVLVTGGAGGIGRAIYCRFVKEGAKVAILDLNKAGAEELAAELNAKGATVRAYGADLADLQTVTDAVAAAWCSTSSAPA